jgi:dephospho-CoA kinase
VVRFRDELRADPEFRRDYERTKQRAAAAHADDADYDDYTRDKGVWLAAAHARLDGGTPPAGPA